MKERLHRFVGIGWCFVLVCAVAGCKSEPTQEEQAHAKSMVVVTPAPVQEATPAAPMQPVRVRTKEALEQMTPQDALGKLHAGNERFLSRRMRVRDFPQEVKATAGHQYPFAVVLSCIDSRSPAELIFDQGIGDLFNARVAGNVLNDDVLGSLEFACKITGSKLIVVLGHSNCGAVKGAIDDVKMGALTQLVDKIKPAETLVPQRVQPRTSKNPLFVDQVAEENVRLVMKQIRERSPVLRELIDSGKVGIVGAMYDLGTGEARFFSK